MALITLTEATAWAEQTKMAPALVALDDALLTHLESEVLTTLNAAVDTSSWTTTSNTPQIVKTIISKLYVSWLIDRQYSEDEDLSAYAGRLAANASNLLTGIVSGDIEIIGVPSIGTGQPGFYPTDVSSSQTATSDDPSLGGPYFSMGAVF